PPCGRRGGQNPAFVGPAAATTAAATRIVAGVIGNAHVLLLPPAVVAKLAPVDAAATIVYCRRCRRVEWHHPSLVTGAPPQVVGVTAVVLNPEPSVAAAAPVVRFRRRCRRRRYPVGDLAGSGGG
ncbi:unnamed protein product, partial [Ectocarpus sp. 4 AP-2014]